MPNEYIVNPVDHSTLSAGGTVAAGAIGGGLRSGAKTALWCIAGFAAVGLLIGTGGLSAFLGLFSGAGSAASAVLWTAGAAVVGAVVSPFVGVIGAALGAGKGSLQAVERVSQERGAAKMMDMQMGAYQAQVMAQAAGGNRYDFPVQGSSKNQASPRIQADALQNLGTIADRQLQIA